MQSTPEPTPVTGHDTRAAMQDIHEMHMDVIQAMNGMGGGQVGPMMRMGWMAAPSNGTPGGRAMAASDMPDEQANVDLSRTVRSVIAELQLRQHQAAFHRLGVRTVADLKHLTESELDEIGLTACEKRRFARGFE